MNTRNGSSDSYNGAFIAAICQSFPDKIDCLAQDQKVLFITSIFKALPNIELEHDNEATLKLSEFYEDEGQAEFSATHEVLLHYLNKLGAALYTEKKFKSMVAAGQAMNTLHLEDYWKHGIINEQTTHQSLQGINL